MKENTAVSIKNVTKTFYLPQDNYDSIKIKLLNTFKKRDKTKTRYQALNGISLDIKEGEFIGILGRNGAGKSTLLKIIAEIYQPSTGSIKVNGRLMPFIELGVGFNKNLSGRDNVYLNGAMLGFSRAEIDKMYESIVDFAELHTFMNQKLRNYSSGMKVRLAFSIAIKADADILLLDEVLAVGDAAFKRKCYEYFNTLKRSNKTIIFVTHNMSAVRDYCNRAVLIEDGKVVFDGNPEEAVDQYYTLFNTKQEKKVDGKHLSLDDVCVKMSDESLAFEVNMINHTSTAANDVLVRLAVKRQNGRVVAGFDNKNIDQPFEIDFAPQERKKITFEVPNIIGNGNYSINAAIRSAAKEGYAGEEDEEEEIAQTVYDSRIDIANFSIRKPGLVTPVILPATVRNTARLKK